MNFVNKDHFILVDLLAKSQTSIDVTDRDLLDRASFRPVDRHEIVKKKTVEASPAVSPSHATKSAALSGELSCQRFAQCSKTVLLPL